MRELGRVVADVLWPPVCPGCGSASTGFCGPCAAALIAMPVAGCRRCGEPVPPLAADCGASHRELAGIRFHAVPYRFAGTGGGLVRRFKLDGDPGAGRTLARAMARVLRPRLQGNFRRALLVPVPLHRSRLRERGFDQALWLAQEVARILQLQVLPRALRRTHATLPQGDPRVLSRAANVAAVFAVGPGRALVGRRVILVDDVMTSGATARRCAALLRAAGAAEVGLLTACRS